MLKTIQRLLIVILLLAVGSYLLYQAFFYNRTRSLYPLGMTIADVDVSGLLRDEARAKLLETYAQPVAIYHREERTELAPVEAGFMMDVESMLDKADGLRAEESFWTGFAAYLMERPFSPAHIALIATHDPAAVSERIQAVAIYLDHPAVSPQLLPETDKYEVGTDGYVTDIEASLPAVEAALYRATDRNAHLIIEEQTPSDLDIALLQTNVERMIDGFDGFGSAFIIDLETGEEVSINGDVALSGMSILKIPIFIEAFRYIDGVPEEGSYYYQLFYETAVHSSNYDANQLLHVIAGENNTYRGADILTESMEKLGLVNTFMVVPYDAYPPDYRPQTKITPANSGGGQNVLPDPARQTTAEEMGTLLSMLYYCAEGTGGLLAVYPDEITADECQFIIDILILNVEGNILRFGVPEEVPVSHKHGWGLTDHGDAGIVYSPGGDYAIYVYLSRPETDWLSSEESFPVMREISRLTYNYFNFENPNTEDPATRALRVGAQLEAEAAAAAATAEAGAVVDEGATDTPIVTPEPTPTAQGSDG
jgi:hypothetical protein